MDKNDFEKKRLMDNLTVAAMEKLNGGILRVLNIYAGFRYRPAEEIFTLFLDGDDETGVYNAIAYLQQSGYIDIREKEGKTLVDVYDFDLEDLEIRLTPKGAQLLAFKINDVLVKI
jgi:hypothetical protein